MNRRKTDLPRSVVIEPYRDPRTQDRIDALLEADQDRRVAARRIANADRRRSQAVDRIAQEYAHMLPPFQQQAGMQA